MQWSQREETESTHVEKYSLLYNNTLNFNYKGPLYMNIDGQGDWMFHEGLYRLSADAV